MRWVAGIIIALVSAASPPSAQAAMVTYGFGCISANVAAACNVGQAQLLVDVTDDGSGFIGLTLAPNQALFVFRNVGPANSSITDIYFDDGTLLGVASLRNTAGLVEFSLGASPPNLPGGNNVGFNATAGFSVDSDPPTQPMGVNPGERLGVVFNLINGTTYNDLLTAINGGSALKIGLHAQGFEGGQSASFVNAPTPVPLPASAGLLLIGLAALARRRRLQT